MMEALKRYSGNIIMSDLTTPHLQALLRANAVRRIAIVQRRGLFEIWVHAGPSLAESGSEALFTTRGDLRQWSSLGAAYRFIREQGYIGTVEVDDATEPADEPEGLPERVEVIACESGQYRFAVNDADGVEVCGGGGFCDPETALVFGQTPMRAYVSMP